MKKEAFKIAIIGSGGAGLSAALEASGLTDGVVLITKSTLGSSNTALAQGGIAASLGEEDSPAIHFEDTMRCGSFQNSPALVKEMVTGAASTIKWLEKQDVLFDRDKTGRYMLKKSLGSTKERLLSCGDKTGAVIIKSLKDRLKKTSVKLLENSLVTDIKRKGRKFEIRYDDGKEQALLADKVILCSGGSSFSEASSRNVFSTNCGDATGEIEKMAARLGAKRKNPYSYQYHPLGYLFPEALRGKPIPETVLSFGAVITGRKGRVEFDPNKNRKALSSKMMRSAKDGEAFNTPAGPGFKLDLRPVINEYGMDLIKKKFPKLAGNCRKHGIDLSKKLLWIFPTLHYQNGGIRINRNAGTSVRGLYACGEVAGGIHGTGRLMGNSLLDIIYFGRKAGRIASGKER
ncbi:MAG: FAD-dependent oxidoreductase [Candidatus Omnitrophota bacterium]